MGSYRPEQCPLLDTIAGPFFIEDSYLHLDHTGTPHIPADRLNLIAQALEWPLKRVAAYSWLAERVVEEAEEEVALSRAAGEFV